MKTSTGFEFEIDRNTVADDWELVELLVAGDGGDLNAAICAMKAVLGEDTYKALKEHVRNEAGKVSATQIKNEFLEILTLLGSDSLDAKN